MPSRKNINICFGKSSYYKVRTPLLTKLCLSGIKRSSVKIIHYQNYLASTPEKNRNRNNISSLRYCFCSSLLLFYSKRQKYLPFTIHNSRRYLTVSLLSSHSSPIIWLPLCPYPSITVIRCSTVSESSSSTALGSNAPFRLFSESRKLSPAIG